jgi:hypothetical protein
MRTANARPARGERARVLAERSDQVERGVTAAPRVVLVRDRRPEEGHDAVAAEVVDGAFEAMDARREDLEEAVEHAMPFLGVDLLGELHRVHDVREEHGHVLSLALHGAPLAEDLLGQMCRRARQPARRRPPPRRAPQPSQKRCPGGLTVAQRGHVAGAASEPPHSLQKLAVARFSCRQRGHRIADAPPAVLARARPPTQWFRSARRPKR